MSERARFIYALTLAAAAAADLWFSMPYCALYMAAIGAFILTRSN